MLYLLYLHILPYIITVKTEFLHKISMIFTFQIFTKLYILIMSFKRKSELIVALLIEIIKKSTNMEQLKIKI